MSLDLFGLERFDGGPGGSASQGALQFSDFEPAVVGPSCPTCHRALQTTPSGWLVCPQGHGRLVIPATARQLRMATVPVPIWVQSP